MSNRPTPPTQEFTTWGALAVGDTFTTAGYAQPITVATTTSEGDVVLVKDTQGLSYVALAATAAVKLG